MLAWYAVATIDVSSCGESVLLRKWNKKIRYPSELQVQSEWARRRCGWEWWDLRWWWRWQCWVVSRKCYHSHEAVRNMICGRVKVFIICGWNNRFCNFYLSTNSSQQSSWCPVRWQSLHSCLRARQGYEESWGNVPPQNKKNSESTCRARYLDEGLRSVVCVSHHRLVNWKQLELLPSKLYHPILEVSVTYLHFV